MVEKITERFLRYVQFHTTSNEESNSVPSTKNQLLFANELKNELTHLGLKSVTVTPQGYLYASLPANDATKAPNIGFIAHLDTSPEVTGENVKPQIIRNYNGKDILLKNGEIIDIKSFPSLKNYVGQDIITTDGTTLLGADDKAGVCEIVTAIEYLIAHPEIKHGKISIGFTPDEEIGRGADYFDIKQFDAEWAYTVDGGEIGELEYENFNAAHCKINFYGKNIHPGYAKGKMINATYLATEFTTLLPKNERPETTEKYEGFYHLISFDGTVEKATLEYIIRDHDANLFSQKKNNLLNLASQMKKKYGENSIEIEIEDNYYNMKEKILPVMHIVETAQKAMQNVGVKPQIKPIRGGTDGARLSFMGLPCPNLFTGGENFHGKREFIPIPSMVKATETIIEIIKQNTKKL